MAIWSFIWRTFLAIVSGVIAGMIACLIIPLDTLGIRVSVVVSGMIVSWLVNCELWCWRYEAAQPETSK